jgi:hypothetical protein
LRHGLTAETVIDGLDSSLGTEHENRSGKRILPKRLARQRHKAISAFMEIDRFGRDQHPHSRWNRDHVTAPSRLEASVSSVSVSVPGGTRTVAALITISMGQDFRLAGEIGAPPRISPATSP